MLELEKDLRDDCIQLALFMRKPRSKGEVAHSFLAEHFHLESTLRQRQENAHILSHMCMCLHTHVHAHAHAVLLTLSLSHMCVLVHPALLTSVNSRDDILVRRGGSSSYVKFYFIFPTSFLTNTNCTYFSCTMGCFDLCIYWAVIITIKLINTPSPHIVTFLLWWETLRMFSLTRFQVYNTLSLNIVTELPITSPEVITIL